MEEIIMNTNKIIEKAKESCDLNTHNQQVMI